MTDPRDEESFKADLLALLQRGRDALLLKLEGLSEYDARRPMTPTGTNVLGVVKHVAWVEAGYLGESFGRPFPEPEPWADLDENDPTADPNVDLWATADESIGSITALYRAVWTNSDATVAATALDARGTVPWWPEERRHPTLLRILAHMVAETNRHAGQLDIVRETIDGQVGHLWAGQNLPERDEAWWTAYHDKLQTLADGVRSA